MANAQVRAAPARGDRRGRPAGAILDAVYARLREAPAEPLSIDAVAAAAGVARSTVYLVFGSRPGCSTRWPTDLLERGRLDRLLEAVAHPDAREQLRGAIRASCEMFAVDRDVRRAWCPCRRWTPRPWAGRSSAGRGGPAPRHGPAWPVGWTSRALLQPGVTGDDAAHLLWVLSSFDSFDSLYVGYGLDVDATCRVLTWTAGEPC